MVLFSFPRGPVEFVEWVTNAKRVHCISECNLHRGDDYLLHFVQMEGQSFKKYLSFINFVSSFCITSRFSVLCAKVHNFYWVSGRKLQECVSLAVRTQDPLIGFS